MSISSTEPTPDAAPSLTTTLAVFEQIATEIQAIAALTKGSSHECAVQRTCLDDFYVTGSAVRHFMYQQQKNHSHKLTLTFPYSELPAIFAIASARGHALKPSLDINIERNSFGITRHDLPSGQGNVLWSNLTPPYQNQDIPHNILKETRKRIGAFIAHCAPELAAIIFILNPAYTPSEQTLAQESNALVDLAATMKRQSPHDRFKELQAAAARPRRFFY